MTWHNPKKISPPKNGEEFLALFRHCERLPICAEVIKWDESGNKFKNTSGEYTICWEDELIAWRTIPSLPMNWRK